MAGDWIKVRKSLHTDGRVVRISSALDADRLRTVGGLIAAWCLFDEHTEDGLLDGYTPKVFDEIIGFPGLCHAMASVGWVVIHAQSLEAVNFTEHNGASARRRAQESSRKNDEREAAKCPQSVRKVSASDADKKRTGCGPEKRREEKRLVVATTVAPTSVPLAESFPAEIQSAWMEWQDYRLARASAKGRAKLPWTEQAQRLSKSQVEIYYHSHGSRIVADRITAAIAGNWQGLNFDKLESQPMLPNNPQPIQKSFAQIDEERKKTDRHGPEKIEHKIYDWKATATDEELKSWGVDR